MRTNLKLNVCRGIFNRIINYSYSRFKVRYYTKGPKQGVNPFTKKFRDKNKDESKVVTRICLTIFGNGAVGQPRCVALFTDFKAFLFNCGEGVGRLCREYEVEFFKIKHVFITQRTWKNLSGLVDIYVTNEVTGVPKMTIYGPPAVECFTNLVTSFRMSVNLVKRSEYLDENFKISQIPIKSSIPRYHSQLTGNKVNDDIVHSYVCRIFERLGDLNVEKCVDLGVPLGPHLLKLKNGEDVVLPSGRVIYSSDVLDSQHPAMTFLVVDCPSEQFLDSFVNEEQFSEYQLPTDNANEVSYVFHFSPPNIIKEKKYLNWMQKFHQGTQHFILNSSNPSISSGAVDQTQNILHLVHPEIFKLLPGEEKVDQQKLPVSSEMIYPPPMLQIHLRPEKKLSRYHVVSYNSEDYSEMLKEFPDFNNELSKLKSCVSSISKPNDSLTNRHFSQSALKSSKYSTAARDIQEYPEVLFLGTSSATSTAFRNVSSILLNINAGKSILLDCGEGTFMQLVRYFGKADIDTVLRKISCVFITHKHTDHYLGLFEILKARKEAFENSSLTYQPIALILPFVIQDIFHMFYEKFESSKIKVRIFSCKSLASQHKNHDFLANFLGYVKLQTVPVKHCYDAYGVVLQFGSKWKIVYSGDTAPCQKLIEAGENCTLLIHEASIEDNLVSEATQKRHSTPSQVVEVAEKMNAQYTIMTHFSKRYLAVPTFPGCNQRHIGYAFDFMKVRLHELPLLPLLLPALQCLFQEQLDNHLEKSSQSLQLENIFLKTYRSLRIS